MGENSWWNHNGSGNAVCAVGVHVPRSGLMSHHPPYRIFGYELAACHGIPAIVMILGALSLSIIMIESASQYVKPITLDSIWVEPRTVTTAQIRDQTEQVGAVKIHKTGQWSRLCNVTAKQTFIDERGGTMMQGEYHAVDTPRKNGRFSNKSRDLQIPKLLANQPGIWRVRIDNSGQCNWLERFFPIGGMTAEATFEIVP